MDLLEYLEKNHKGKGKAVHSYTLERLFQIDGRTLRRRISKLRQAGHPICSDASGYYYADNQNEINRTVSRLNTLVMRISNARTGLMYSKPKNPKKIEIVVKLVGE